MKVPTSYPADRTAASPWIDTRSRRRFLADAALAASVAAAGPWWTPRSRAAEAGPVKAEPDVIIYDGEYPGWPWVTAGADGTFHCVFREGTVHDYSAAGRILLTSSADRGRSWSEPRVIVDAPDVDDRNVAVAQLANNDLLATYNSYDSQRASQALAIRSGDGGRTWSAGRPLDHSNTRTRAAAVVLASGRVLLPYYVAPGSGSLAALSDDNGGRWKTFRVPDAEGFVGDEWDALEVEPGRLVGIFRNSHATSDGTFWRSESRDDAQTWSTPVGTNVASQRSSSPAQFARHGKTPTLIYADRRMVSVSAVRSDDPDFIRWDVAHRLPCYLYNADESPILDGSYPASVELGPGSRLVVDYEIRPASRRITGYFVDFPLDWDAGG